MAASPEPNAEPAVCLILAGGSGRMDSQRLEPAAQQVELARPPAEIGMSERDMNWLPSALERSAAPQSDMEARVAVAATKAESDDYCEPEPEDEDAEGIPPPPATSRDFPRKPAVTQAESDNYCEPERDDEPGRSADVLVGGLRSRRIHGLLPPKPAISRERPRKSAPTRPPVEARRRRPRVRRTAVGQWARAAG